MTLAEAKTRLEEVEQVMKAGDYEMAHGKEDLLLRDILRAIAYGGAPDAYLLAGVGVNCTRLQYPRRCA